MATPRLARSPTCLSCLRRLARPSPSTFSPLPLTQTRAKTTKAEEEDLQGIPVRLLQDIQTFGRKNAIIRVKPGRMRNYWFPKNQAEYMTRLRFKELGLSESAIGVRDRTFGARLKLGDGDKDKSKGKKKEAAEPEIRKKKEVLTLSPEDSLALLRTLLPSTLTFTRKPISAPPPPAPAAPAVPRSPSLAANAATSTPSPDPEPAGGKPEPIAIFGSVSTGDILAAIKEQLQADNAQGDRIGLEAEGIEIVGLEEGEDRIKHLGSFEIRISTSKELETVRRTVEVVAEASE
ncbi:hypothetical protein F5B20DRAFT_586803 [Whalleya microplaca]|nr:hypothetical protein F5B20DRAFT_586803 [Whalleya microplaca]